MVSKSYSWTYPLVPNSHAIATQHQTTVANIRHNRTADRIAKVCVKRQLATFSPPKAEILTSATVWQKWLVHIATQIALSRGNDNAEDSQPNIVNPPAPCDNHENRLCIPNVYDITPEHSLEIFKFYLPKWMWEPEIEKFDWVSSFPSDHRLSSYACISQANWETALAFFRTLKWQINENLHVSYIELAFHFHYSGFSFVGVDQTPSEISTIIRKVINQASKCNLQHALVCGTQKAGCISEGKTLPAGFVKGCKPLLNITAIKNLAVQLLRGRKHGLKHWDFPLNWFPLEEFLVMLLWWFFLWICFTPTLLLQKVQEKRFARPIRMRVTIWLIFFRWAVSTTN